MTKRTNNAFQIIGAVSFFVMASYSLSCDLQREPAITNVIIKEQCKAEKERIRHYEGEIQILNDYIDELEKDLRGKTNKDTAEEIINSGSSVCFDRDGNPYPCATPKHYDVPE